MPIKKYIFQESIAKSQNFSLGNRIYYSLSLNYFELFKKEKNPNSWKPGGSITFLLQTLCKILITQLLISNKVVWVV